MTATKAQQVFSDTRVRRDEARALLSALMDVKTRTEQNGVPPRTHDSLESVTGRSAMDKAIDSTRRLVDSFNRVLDDLRDDLSNEDLALLADIEDGQQGAIRVVLGSGSAQAT